MKDKIAQVATILIACGLMIYFGYEPLWQATETIREPMQVRVVESLLKGFR